MNVERVMATEQVKPWVDASLRDPLALTFSHYVAEQMDWAAAHVRTFVQVGLADDALLDFQHGGKIAGGPHPDDWLIEFLNAMRDPSHSFFFVEDWLLWPEAEIIRTCALPAVFNGQEVYFAVQADDPRTSESLFGVCCANPVPLFHGFLIQGIQMPSPGSTVSHEQFRALARHVQAMYFGVYDGESYLVCPFDKPG